MKKLVVSMVFLSLVGFAGTVTGESAAAGAQKPDSVGLAIVEKDGGSLFSAAILCTVDCDGQGGEPDWQGTLENVDQCLGACVVACQVSSCRVMDQ